MSKTQRRILKTVRFTEEETKLIKQLADEYDLSDSQVIRLAMNGGMEEFLGNIQYVDKETGLAMKEAVMRCGNIMQSVQNELHRIGVNFNQALKLEYVRKKEEALDREWKYGSVDARLGVSEKRKNLEKEKEEIESGTGTLSKEELDKLLERYEAATKEVSKLLWRTQK